MKPHSSTSDEHVLKVVGDDTPITRRLLMPSDFFFLICPPMNKRGHREALLTPERRDLIPCIAPIWSDYFNAVVSFSKRTLPALQRMGVNIVFDASLSDLVRVTKEHPHKGVVIYTHWTMSHVEFSEGLIPFETVVEAVSPHFRSVLDLCICNVEPLAKVFRASRPDSIVRYIAKQVYPPGLWLYFYVALFSRLVGGDRTYLEARDEAEAAFLKDIEER